MNSSLDKLIFDTIQVLVRSYKILNSLLCLRFGIKSNEVTDQDKSNLRTFLQTTINRKRKN
jgi:hypothetical protein